MLTQYALLFMHVVIVVWKLLLITLLNIWGTKFGFVKFVRC